MERETRLAVEVNNVLNLCLQTPCVPAIVRQMGKDERGRESERKSKMAGL